MKITTETTIENGRLLIEQKFVFPGRNGCAMVNLNLHPDHVSGLNIALMPCNLPKVQDTPYYHGIEYYFDILGLCAALYQEEQDLPEDQFREKMQKKILSKTENSMKCFFSNETGPVLLDSITIASLSHFWRVLTDAQRERFAKAMTDFEALASIIGNFKTSIAYDVNESLKEFDFHY